MTIKQLRLLEAREQIETAFEILKRYEIPHSVSREAFEAMVETASRTPDDDDMRWPLVEVEGIADHLTENDEERPLLSTQLATGRAYALSPAQRDVVRKWFNMTPAPLVEVIDLALFPETKFVRHVVLRSMEHIDPRRRRVMNKFTIDRWGKFMSAVAEREAELAEQRELDSYTSRVETLFQRAKDEKVQHKQRTAGYLANRLHTEVRNRKLEDPKEVRELFRSILLSVHEHELAKLVREPKFWPDKGAEPSRTASKVKSLDALANEYGV